MARMEHCTEVFQLHTAHPLPSGSGTEQQQASAVESTVLTPVGPTDTDMPNSSDRENNHQVLGRDIYIPFPTNGTEMDKQR